MKEEIKKLTEAYNFTREEIDLIKFGVDVYTQQKDWIPLDVINALDKWNRYYTELKDMMLS